ncbi:DUF2303 family protein [Methylolobus aquaticus]
MSLDIDGTPAHLVPEGWTLVEHVEARGAPRRVEADVTLTTLESFIAFVSAHGDAQSAIFVDTLSGKTEFCAILDYHLGQKADWCKFKARYECPRTPEFQDWQEKSGKSMPQTDFAEFIEDHLPDIVDPPAAEMAEIARGLVADIKIKFTKAVRLDNGETQLQYREEINGAAGPSGQLKIPQTIKLGLPLFMGGEPYAVEARFKYRIRDGVLSMWYELIRPHRLIDDAVDTMVKAVRAEWPGHIYFGKP